MTNQNTKDIYEEAGLDPSQWQVSPATKPAPPSVGDITPVIPQYFQGSLDPSVQHDADFVNTALRSSSAPRFALMPPGIQSSALTSAQLTSAIKTNAPAAVPTTTSGSSEITLDIPAEFTPTTQTVTLPGPLEFDWATQPAGYELQAPDGTVGFDGAVGTSGLSAGPLALTSGLPSTNPEWAFYCAVLLTATFSVTTLPGWTAIAGNDVNNAFFIRNIPTGSTVSVSQGFSTTGSFSGAILNFSGTVPAIIQSKSAPDIGTGSITATFTSNTTAGSFIIAVYHCTSVTNAPAPGIFSDTQTLKITPLSYTSNPGNGTHPGTASQVVLLSTASASAEAVTVTYPNVNAGELYIYEISGLSAIAVKPRFSPEPPTDLSNVTGRLPLFNGGTGANLSGTGGTSKVLRQSGLGAAITVSQLSASDLSDGTIGTGAVVKAITPTITTPQFTGVFGTYNGINLVSNGVPAEYAKVDLTAQAAAITATTLYAVPAGGVGMYRISWVAKVTQVDAVSSTLGGTNGFQILYTDSTDSVVVTTPPWWEGGNNGTAPTSASGNNTGTYVGGSIIVYAKASTNIQYQMGYTSGVTPMQYNLHIKLEAL